MSCTSLSVVSDSVRVRVAAKINLHLGVGARRDDGYHDLVTVFQALGVHDEITLTPAEHLGIAVTRPTGRGADDGAVPTDDSNLAARAARALAARCGRDPNVAIEIAKSIPVAGGMAGGSADAAGTLVGLSELWQVDLDHGDLDGIAAGLGSDVPFALHGNTALGTGRGERLMPVLARGPLHWVLAFGREGLPTPAVFAELDRLRAETSGGAGQVVAESEPTDAGALMSALAQGDPAAIAPLLRNDLQPAALSLRPVLRRTLRAGMDAGALGGIVSGSGPTCAFLVADENAAIAVTAELAGAGVARSVRATTGPVPGARVIADH